MTQRLSVTHSSEESSERTSHKKSSRKITFKPLSLLKEIVSWEFLCKWHSGMTRFTLLHRLSLEMLSRTVCSSNLHASVDVILSTIIGFTFFDVYILNLSLGRINLHIYCFHLCRHLLSLMWRSQDIKISFVFPPLDGWEKNTFTLHRTHHKSFSVSTNPHFCVQTGEKPETYLVRNLVEEKILEH